jgi:hypothetical protein
LALGWFLPKESLILLQGSLFQNPVGFGTGFRKSGLTPVFPHTFKVAVPKLKFWNSLKELRFYMHWPCREDRSKKPIKKLDSLGV